MIDTVYASAADEDAALMDDALIEYAETLPRDDFGAIDVTLIGLQVIEAYL